MKFPPPNRRRGSAVVIMLALLSLLLVLVNANTSNVRNLNRELHRLEEQQMKRWQTLPLNRWSNPPLAPPGRGTSGSDASNIRLPSSEGLGVGSGESFTTALPSPRTP